MHCWWSSELTVETCSPYSLVQEVRCNNRYSMECLPYRVYGISSAHRWRVQHISLGNLHVHAWSQDSMLRRSSWAVPTYSELFFNRIKCSESTEVILCMDGDVTPEENTKPYLDQVYGGWVIHFSTWQDLAAAERVLPRLHDHNLR